MLTSRLMCVSALAVIAAACGESVAEENAPSVAGEAAATEAEVARARDALEEIDLRWEQAANRGDAAGVAGLYADDGRLLPPNSEIVQGRQSIQRAVQGLVDAGMRNVDFTTVDVGVSGDLAYEIGHYSLDIQSPGAERPITDRGKYVLVVRRQPDGRWKIVADIFNTSQPAPDPR